MCVRAQLLSCAWLFVTLWTIARQAPLSMGFSRQEYWGGLLWGTTTQPWPSGWIWLASPTATCPLCSPVSNLTLLSPSNSLTPSTCTSFSFWNLPLCFLQSWSRQTPLPQKTFPYLLPIWLLLISSPCLKPHFLWRLLTASSTPCIFFHTLLLS